MSTIVIWILAFAFAISVLVAVHEFGHFWVARRLGIKVLRFSIGFGKPLWRRTGKVDGTEYVISALPLGGYVKMLDERDCTVAPEEKQRAFNNAPIWARLAVLAAGPAFNFLFAIVVYWVMFMVGDTLLRPVIGDVAEDSYAAAAGLQAGDEMIAVGGEPVQSWQDATLAIIDDMIDDGRISIEVREATGSTRSALIDVGGEQRRLTEPGELLPGLGISVWPSNIPAQIGQLVPGEAAERSGLLPGDLLLAADDAEIGTWREWYDFVRANPSRTVRLLLQRDGREMELDLAIGEMRDQGETVGRIGAGPVDLAAQRELSVRYGPVEAMSRAVGRTAEMSIFTVRMLWRMVTGDFSARNLSGPITIAEYAGTTAQMGPEFFIKFLAIVSISLGILNLLPVPILDGGQMVFQLAEALKGSPLSPETELRGQQVGIFLLLMLMSLAFYNDILRLMG
ncbi:MAG: RIP metalloprotease RseP [Gammaproteobacteria bacterium]|nr:RIP metalloprotease RseP [Gammaproteobacteria bacterium]NNF59830.1 RIP metalloprotease RseP [Gammaproteobacteria bacterium]NNM21296.1 RIP metalloprotease RseP [Gammaproteobacteria bacterium]